MTYIWAEQGSRPPALRDQRYDWAYIFGAVCPARETGVALVLPEANAEAMNLHLAAISQQVSPGAFAVIVLHGAGWHQTGGRLNWRSSDGAGKSGPAALAAVFAGIEPGRERLAVFAAELP